MNEIDKTPPPITTINTGQPLPTSGTSAPNTQLPYDTSGAPSPKVQKGNAPPLNHTPDSEFDLSSALSLSGTIAGSVEYDVFAVMDVMEKSMVENAKVAEDDAVQAALDVASKLKEAAHAIREAAKFALGAGLAMGSMQIAGGAISLGGAVASTKVLSGGAETTETAPLDTSESEVETNNPQEDEAKASSPTEPTSESTESQQTKTLEQSDETTNDIRTQEKKLQQAVEKANDVPLNDEEVGNTESPNKADKNDAVNEEKAAQKKLRTKTKGGGNLITYQRAQYISTFTQGVSQIVQGMGQTISTVLKYYSDEKQAESKDIDAESSEKRSLAEQKKAYAESVRSDAEKVYDQMQQLMQSSNTTTEAIATRV